MAYLKTLPENCPPADANGSEQERTVFRLVKPVRQRCMIFVHNDQNAPKQILRWMSVTLLAYRFILKPRLWIMQENFLAIKAPWLAR